MCLPRTVVSHDELVPERAHHGPALIRMRPGPCRFLGDRPLLRPAQINLMRWEAARRGGHTWAAPSRSRIYGTSCRGTTARPRSAPTTNSQTWLASEERSDSRPGRFAQLVPSMNETPAPQIASKNSALDLNSFNDLINRSIASTGLSANSAPRSFLTFSYSCWLNSFSSFRVPEVWMLMAGKMRFSASWRSRLISELPVPLNSSKITSSMREPVSISAVATIVREPPSSALRAAPKKRFGRSSARESMPPDKVLPLDSTSLL